MQHKPLCNFSLHSVKACQFTGTESLIINPVTGDEGHYRQYGTVLALLTLFIAACLYAAVAFAYPDREIGSFFGASGTAEPSLALATQAAPFEIKPVSDPDALNPVDARTAQHINALIPIADAVNPASRPFIVSTHDGVNWQRSIDCMTAAIYYESAMESVAGQRAVAQVVLNRVRDPAFPKNICGVIFEGSTRRTGCQFSFTCDGSLSRKPSVTGWSRARAVATMALGGYVHAPVGYSTHYHANYVNPYWAPKLVKTAVIGAHIFYRWPGRRGGPAVINAGYAGAEPAVFGSDLAGGADALNSAAGLNTANFPEGNIPMARGILSIDGKGNGLSTEEIASGSEGPKSDAAPKRRAGHRWVIGVAPIEPTSDTALTETGPANTQRASQ